MIPVDTSLDAHRTQLAVYRRIGPAGRVMLAMSMSEEGRQIVAAGVRRRHPEYDEATVLAAVRRVLVGERLFRAAWPAAPIVAA